MVVKLANLAIGLMIISMVGSLVGGRVGSYFDLLFLLSVVAVGLLVIHGRLDASSPYWVFWRQRRA